jgi:hypothetical protein
VEALDPTGGTNQTRSFTPNTAYGALGCGARFAMNLTAGKYVFDSIKAGIGFTINAVPGAHVFVCGAVTIASASVSGVTSDQFSTEVQSSDRPGVERELYRESGSGGCQQPHRQLSPRLGPDLLDRAARWPARATPPF